MVIELVIDRIVAGGTGLGEVEGRKVFVPLAAPHERLRVRVEVEKRDYLVARIQDVIEPSAYRIEPRCPWFGQCGGCQLQHLTYEAQLTAKQEIVVDALRRIGGIEIDVASTVPASQPWHYRNRTRYTIGGGASPHIGFLRAGTHDLLDVSECLLHPAAFDRVRTAMLACLATAGRTTSDKRTRSNTPHHLLVRDAGNGLLVIPVTRNQSMDPALVQALIDQPDVVGVTQNINPDPANRVVTDKFLSRAGRDSLTYPVAGCRLRVSAGAFFQVNLPQAETICRKVAERVAPTGTERVLDLFSGVGMIALSLAGSVREVIGVETFPPAVEDARFNARDNKLGNARFIVGDVARALTDVRKADVVVLDPPRKGCSPATLKGITALTPRRIVYVSCNPATLARDLKRLVGSGYRLTTVDPIDMFPQTAHIETIATLDRNDA
jgi:23S rRNA (uracil1939-C5)-methyltransferase